MVEKIEGRWSEISPHTAIEKINEIIDMLDQLGDLVAKIDERLREHTHAVGEYTNTETPTFQD